jgi:hypothetical protein
MLARLITLWRIVTLPLRLLVVIPALIVIAIIGLVCWLGDLNAESRCV